MIDGSYYYFDEQGIMQTGFLELDGEKYYLDENGKMHTGRLDLDGKSYYFDEQGHMIRDAWIENRYYVDENGEMLKNQQNGEGVYFDENGNRSFNAESLYKEHPDSILAIVSKEKRTEIITSFLPKSTIIRRMDAPAERWPMKRKLCFLSQHLCVIWMKIYRLLRRKMLFLSCRIFICRKLYRTRTV